MYVKYRTKTINLWRIQTCITTSTKAYSYTNAEAIRSLAPLDVLVGSIWNYESNPLYNNNTVAWFQV